jgi:DNA-binding MarR family transcriptional regulator
MARTLTDDSVRVWARLIRVEQKLLDAVEAALKAAKLPPLVWYDVLLELAREPDGRLRHRDLYARMLLAKYNLSRLVDRMSAAKLVSREAIDDDARGAYIQITTAGRAMRSRMWSVYGRAIAKNFSARLDRDDIDDLSRILEKLRP